MEGEKEGKVAGGRRVGETKGKRKEEKRRAMKYYLNRVRINAGGYDEQSCYWGLGFPVWEFSSRDGSSSGRVKAWCREAAIARIVKEVDGKATFYRGVGLISSRGEKVD